MSKRDYYDILGVNKSANADEIKKAYRKMAIKYHPDKNPGDKSAEEKFKEAAEAYDVLSNADKKSQYDRFGHAGVGGSGGFSGGGFSMDDIFSQFGDVFGQDSPFGSFFGGGQRGGQNTQGSNIRVKLKLTLSEMKNGVEKTIRYRRFVPAPNVKYATCRTCNGRGVVTQVRNTFLGQMQTSSNCPNCRGLGKYIESKPKEANENGLIGEDFETTVKIPGGVAEGMQLSVSGKGSAGAAGGIFGDLIVLIEEVEHESLFRDESNVIYHLNISIPEACLGCQKEIPTLDGPVRIKIDPGTQPAKVLRLKGKGFPNINSYGTGDQLIYINVYIPEKLNTEEKQLLTQLEKSKNFEARSTDSKEKGFFGKMKDFFAE